ncbi:hypothetical protein [Flavobacterium sp. I3-2]|uniref:hypothetical protein n=1 Tax=Flavobacterium sp. I3-2 TaxID=2748319 RepID=UPI0015ABD15F|nr:hypothetical protein [Flavobacterium sp. I3-2]
MKKLYQIFILFFTINFGYAQNILDFFYAIPDIYVDDLSEFARRELISDRARFLDDTYYESIFNLKYNYLSFKKSAEKNSIIQAEVVLKYWPLENGYLLVISKTKRENYNSVQSDFKFLMFKDGVFSEIKSGYLDGYSSDFAVFEKNMMQKFYKKDITKSDRELVRNGTFSVSFDYSRYDFYLYYNSKYDYSYFMSDVLPNLISQSIEFKFDYNDSKFVQM